jgi:hypothetical protein
MGTADSLRASIIEISNRPKSVTLADIESVMSQLNGFERVEVDGNRHTRAWSVCNVGFNVCVCRRGRKHLKEAHVREFLKVMNAIGWYD